MTTAVQEAPIPDTQEARVWAQACTDILGLLLRLKTARPLHGAKWLLGMRRYYMSRLIPLLTDHPEGAQDRANEYKALAETL